MAHPAFSLKDMEGHVRAYSPGRPALIAFVKEDCATCNLTAPVLEAFHRAYGEVADVWMLSQTADGAEILKARHDLTLPILDESALRTSLAYGFDIVPALYWTDAAGEAPAPVEGFVRAEWERLSERMASDLDVAAAQVPWAELPDWRPGCGSKHLDPEIHDRLLAEAEGSPLRARRIEVAASDDIDEFMFDQGFSDGLPLVAPTPERVLRMLAGTRRDPQEVVAVVPPNLAPATVEKIAINAVMAGCRPEYLPVVIAAVEAVCTDEFNIHGVNATTMGASPVLVVNGPIRERIGMNMKLAALGNGNRANATIGRAVRLVIRNLGGAKPGGVDRSTLSNPMKFTMCFAEWEERAPWEPLHVERGFRRKESVVTAFAMTSGPVQIVDQDSRRPDQLAGSLGQGLEAVFLPKAHRMPVDALLVVCPEHIDTLNVDGPYSKARLRERIQAVTTRPLSVMLADEHSGAGISPATAAKLTAAQLAAPSPKFANPKHIHIAVAGSGAGKFSAAFHGWLTGAAGSAVVSRRIED